MMLEAYLLITLLLSTIIMLALAVFLLKKAIVYYRGVKRLHSARLDGVKRPRKRYIVFSLICDDNVSIESLEKALKDVFLRYYGVSVYGKTSPRVIFYDEKNMRGVLRVTHLYVDYAIASLGLLKKINGNNCLAVPLRTTGSLRKAREYLLKIKV